MRSNRRRNWLIKRIALGFAVAAFVAPVLHTFSDRNAIGIDSPVAVLLSLRCDVIPAFQVGDGIIALTVNDLSFIVVADDRHAPVRISISRARVSTKPTSPPTSLLPKPP